MLVGRQNGKGSILEARQLAGLFLLHEQLQVHTAHEFKTCYEHFLRVVNLIEATPDLDNQVMRIRRGAGEQAIELKTGERLRFLARSGGSGRGMSGDAVYLDEAFALTPPMMGALLPTLSARPNPQIWYTSSAPLAVSSVLHGIRKRGHDGKSSRLFFAEWGHDRGVDVTDRDAWYRANPALGIRIFEDFIEAELDAMTAMPEEFARERLGVPDLPDGETQSGPIPVDRWLEMRDDESKPAGAQSVAIDVSPDLKWASIAVAGRRSDGLLHVEVVRRQPGTAWILEFARRKHDELGVEFRVAASGPGGFLLPLLAEAGITTVGVSSGEVSQACNRLISAVDNGEIRWRGLADITSAIANAVITQSSDTMGWSRRKSTADISALVAATIALGGVGDDSDPRVWF